MDATSISPDSLPRVFDFRPLPDGDFAFRIEMDGMTVEGTLSPDYIGALLGAWVIDIQDKLVNGGSLADTPFAEAGLKLHPNTERYSAEERVAAINEFVKQAVIQVMKSIRLRMVKLPMQAFIEAIISIILNMEESEFVRMEVSRAELWNSYLEEVGRTIKRELNVPLAVRTRRWTKPMRRKALRLYEETHEQLRVLKKTYFSTSSAKIRRQNPSLKSWAEAKAEHIYLTGLLELLEIGETPRELALQYVGEMLASSSKETTWDQIKLARKERRQDGRARKPSDPNG